MTELLQPSLEKGFARASGEKSLDNFDVMTSCDRDRERRRREGDDAGQGEHGALHRRHGRTRQELLQRLLQAHRLRRGRGQDPGSVPRRDSATRRSRRCRTSSSTPSISSVRPTRFATGSRPGRRPRKRPQGSRQHAHRGRSAPGARDPRGGTALAHRLDNRRAVPRSWERRNAMREAVDDPYGSGRRFALGRDGLREPFALRGRTLGRPDPRPLFGIRVLADSRAVLDDGRLRRAARRAATTTANSFCTAEHGGTHIDAPIHFAEGRATLDRDPALAADRSGVRDRLATEAAQETRDYAISSRRPEPLGTATRSDSAGRDRSAHGRDHAQYFGDAARYLGTERNGCERRGDAASFPGTRSEGGPTGSSSRGIASVGIDTVEHRSGPVARLRESRDFDDLRRARLREPHGSRGAAARQGAFVVALPDADPRRQRTVPCESSHGSPSPEAPPAFRPNRTRSPIVALRRSDSADLRDHVLAEGSSGSRPGCPCRAPGTGTIEAAGHAEVRVSLDVGLRSVGIRSSTSPTPRSPARIASDGVARLVELLELGRQFLDARGRREPTVAVASRCARRPCPWCRR